MDEQRPAVLARERRVLPKLSAAAITEMVDRYRAGATASELAHSYGVHRTTVTQHLNRSGAEVRSRGMSSQDIDRAVSMYATGWPLARVGRELGFSSGTVALALRRRGVRVRDSQGR